MSAPTTKPGALALATLNSGRTDPFTVASALADLRALIARAERAEAESHERQCALGAAIRDALAEGNRANRSEEACAALRAQVERLAAALRAAIPFLPTNDTLALTVAHNARAALAAIREEGGAK